MHFRSALFGFLAAVAAALSACSDPSAPADDSGAVLAAGIRQANLTGRHIVAFTGTPPADLAARIAALGGQVDWIAGGAGLAVVSGLGSRTAATLAAAPGIGSVTPDFTLSLPLTALAPARAKPSAGLESQVDPAAALFFPLQWNLRAVGADQAWSAGRRGSPAVSVFILDTGIDYLHADLAGLVDAGRSADLLGTFGVTVGAAPRISIVPFTEADTVAAYYPGRAVYTDLLYHGTLVAATVSSNAVAAAGVTSRTTLVAVKVCAYINVCPVSSVLNGVIYAADHGADVINLSLGGPFTKAGGGGLGAQIQRAFTYATSRGATIVVAAGNDGADMDHDADGYKAYCNAAGVICVSATGPTAEASVAGPWTDVDASATYTNFGRSAVDIAAPGGNMASFVHAACSGTSRLLPVCAGGTYVIGAQGTSMAAPHVAGAAALVVPELGRRPAAVRHRLLSTSDDLGSIGTDAYYGKGRLNVARAASVIPQSLPAASGRRFPR